MNRHRIIFCQFFACVLASAALPCLGQNDVLDRVSREVCLEIGVRAQITGLDDITLATTQGDGESGATYSGTDTFFLESNAPVRIFISAAPINNGLNTLPTEYLIDGSSDLLETAGAGPHAGSHSINIQAQLGSISDQLAGSYSSTLVITVVPQIPVVSHCTETQVISEPVLEESQAETILEIEAKLVEDQRSSAPNPAALPPWAYRIMEQPQADQMFPYLAEYRQWLDGQLPILSAQAESWWLFPVDSRLLEELGIEILNNR
jgi:hypothetical protein